MLQRKLEVRAQLPNDSFKSSEDEMERLRKQLADLAGLDYRKYYQARTKIVMKSEQRASALALVDVRVALDQVLNESLFDLSEAISSLDAKLRGYHANQEEESARPHLLREPMVKSKEPPLLDPVLKPKRKKKSATTLPCVQGLSRELSHEAPAHLTKISCSLFGYGTVDTIKCPLYSWPDDPTPATGVSRCDKGKKNTQVAMQSA